MYVVEFQKRGLLHAHILLILENSHKPRTPEHVEVIISAEIPNQAQYPEFYEIVINCILHGPCGLLATDASYMRNGKCSKGYPKEYCEQTILTSDGYPKYQGTNNGFLVLKGRYRYTNRDIILYNPYLLVKYNCHINVEI